MNAGEYTLVIKIAKGENAKAIAKKRVWKAGNLHCLQGCNKSWRLCKGD